MKTLYQIMLMLLLSWGNLNLCHAQPLIRQNGNVYIEDEGGESWQVDTTKLIVHVDTLKMPTDIGWKVNKLGHAKIFVPPTTPIENVKDSLCNLPYVQSVEYNTFAKSATTYNDPYYENQWYHTAYHFDSLSTAVPTSHKDIIIAIIEGGVDFSHPDFGITLNGSNPQYGALYVNTNETPNNNIDDDGDGYVDNYLGWNFYTNSGTIDPTPTHGTKVFGLIGAKANNSIGTVGLIGERNDIKIMPLCAGPLLMPADCIADAIIYAADHGASIINMSFTASWSTQVRDAISYAKSNGVLMVASAGNNASNTQYPAYDTKVMGVSSVNSSNVLSSFSDCGALDVAAPGEHIYTPTKNYGTYTYGYDDGTSFAAPMVSTLAAYIMAQNPFISADDVRCIIDTTALINPIYSTYQQSYEWGNPNGDTKPYCAQTGFGTIRPNEAIEAAKRKLPYINFYETDSGIDYYDMYFDIGNCPDNICHEPWLEDFPDAEYTYSWDFYPLNSSGFYDYWIDDYGDWFACHFEINTYAQVSPYFYLIGTIKDLDDNIICEMGGLYHFNTSLVGSNNSFAMTGSVKSGRIILKNGTPQKNKQATVVVYSMDKRIVHQQTFDMEQSEITIDVSYLNKGYYIVKVYSDGADIFNEKFLK
ncbi:MAG: S8 family peptidase [Bacteroidaceae bacterium]|nr:S8 family peptidase [Bacteroidaceae bacterium]